MRYIAILFVAIYFLFAPAVSAKNELAELESRVEHLESFPPTEQDVLVGALNDTWPEVPGIMGKILDQARKHERVMDALSVKADFFMERLEEVYVKTQKNHEKNIEQDVYIKKNAADINAVKVENKILEAERRGQYRAILTGILIAIFTAILGAAGFLWRKKIIEKMLRRRADGAVETETLR